MKEALQGARRRNRRGEGGKLRADILAGATELLERTGSEEAVTLRAVARQIGISAPSIYPHFPDRDAIVDAIVDDAFGDFNAAIEDARPCRGRRRARWRAFEQAAPPTCGSRRTAEPVPAPVRAPGPYRRSRRAGAGDPGPRASTCWCAACRTASKPGSQPAPTRSATPPLSGLPCMATRRCMTCCPASPGLTRIPCSTASSTGWRRSRG